NKRLVKSIFICFFICRFSINSNVLVMEFKGKWYSKVTRSSNINGDESVVVFSENDNSSIDKGICRLTILNHEGKVVEDINEMKSNALLISKSPELLEMLNILLHDYKNYIQNILQDTH